MRNIISKLLAIAGVVFVLSGGASHAQITFDSSMESGNGVGFTSLGGQTYSFEIEPDSNSTDRQWFMFEVSGAAGQTLTFRLLNTNATNIPSHWNNARPVASHDGGAVWERTNGTTGHNTSSNTYEFSHTFSSDSELIAFHYPYTYTYVRQRIETWAAHADCDHSLLGRSVEGREIDLLRIADAATTDTTANPEPGAKPGIWLITRLHAAEVTGSWLLDGFMDFVLSDDERMVELRRGIDIYVVPMTNPDGVVEGNYRDNAQGTNLNRVWDSPSSVGSPEVLAIRDATDAWLAAGGKMAFAADLHSSSGAYSHYAFHAAAGIEPPLYDKPEEYRNDTVKFLNLMAKHSDDFHPTRGASSSLSTNLGRQFYMQTAGALAFTFEGTYIYPNFGPLDGQYITPERHRDVGKALALALYEFYILPNKTGVVYY